MNNVSELFTGCLAILFFASLFLLFYTFTLDKDEIIFKYLNKTFLVLTVVPAIFLILVAIYLLIFAMVKTTMFLL
jgi:hypothetical protein|nr:MAG TPA: hypothetical protein [Caudoviricetes sp.]